MKIKRNNNHGFTIIELMIATTVFSVILLVCAVTLIQVSRIYQKGVIDNQTQEVARSVMSNIAESIQFSGGTIRTIASNGSTQGFCIDNKRYSYLLNEKLVDVDPPPVPEQTNYALVADKIGTGCSATTSALSLTGVVDPNLQINELLSPNMSVLDILICQPGPAAGSCPALPVGLYEISVSIAYGDAVLRSGSACTALSRGGSFCSVSKLKTTVQSRIVK